MNNEQQLVQAINNHTEEIATLQCLVIGLLKHIQENQGYDSAHEAITHALAESSKMQPPGRIGGNSQKIRDLAKILG
ncbi:hypothetical protein [Pseudomonas fluorescens]|uniref:Uncharacterized protein n=1 Tax=Pseudomonas fluorescens TaxID=294 RepID=A0A5E6RIZ9_PSEFL|nr:hypothetical protein [Pseudomonas fluorescens]VVM66773.1 hypothetical protein PS652_01565 [Pseudomonas fluorescens]